MLKYNWFLYTQIKIVKLYRKKPKCISKNLRIKLNKIIYTYK